MTRSLYKDIRKQLKMGVIGKIHRVTNEEAEWIRLCRMLEDPKKLLKEAVARQESFKRRVSVSQACIRYREEYCEAERVATKKDANSRSRIIENTIGERYLDSLSELDIEEWRSNLKGSNRHINNTHRHFRHLYERARVWGWVPKGFNPAKEVPLLKEPRTEPVVWQPKDLTKCFEWYENGNCQGNPAARTCFLALGAFAGLRPSEIEGVSGERDGLLWSDINFENRHIHIRPEVAGKLSEPRYISFTKKEECGLSQGLADSLWTSLLHYLEPNRNLNGPITGRRTQHYMSSELRKSNVIESWPKDGLRHTWISSLLALGVHREWIAELAGNSPTVIKKNYKRPLPEEVATEWFCFRLLMIHSWLNIGLFSS